MSDHLSKVNSKFNWESFSEAMDNDKNVVIIDNEGTRYKGKIVRSDNRSTIVLLNDGERRVVFNRTIADFEILDE